MASPNEKLAESLELLRDLQNKRALVAIKSSDLSRTHRERLVENGYLKEVTKGWYIASNPNEQPGDSTSWYTSFWHFCAQFLENKYGNEYCVSAEQSIFFHSGNNTIPIQLIVRANKASNTKIEFLYNTSLFAMESPLPNPSEIVVKNDIRTISLPAALIRCSTTMFKNNPTDLRIAFSQIKDASEILELLLDGSHTVIAGRLAGAFRNIGRDRIADDIIKTMGTAGYDVRETDPFDKIQVPTLFLGERSPYASRIKVMWNNMREIVIRNFPDSPGLPKNQAKYLDSIDQLYLTDAYHSLSIEKYTVSAELINLVKSGGWDLDKNQEHKKHRNAMAARGYYLASIAVKGSIKSILSGSNPGEIVDNDHSNWYRELFAPSVTTGLIKASDLAGYRNGQVFISRSRHVPMNKDAVRDAMPMLFDLLKAEDNSGVRAVLGHFVFAYIHPYMDGNGRMARFLMNTMLASGGYPWTVIPVEERESYMSSLEKASIEGDIKPFTQFIANLVSESLKGTPVAKEL